MTDKNLDQLGRVSVVNASDLFHVRRNGVDYALTAADLSSIIDPSQQIPNLPYSRVFTLSDVVDNKLDLKPPKPLVSKTISVHFDGVFQVPNVVWSYADGIITFSEAVPSDVERITVTAFEVFEVNDEGVDFGIAYVINQPAKQNTNITSELISAIAAGNRKIYIIGDYYISPNNHIQDVDNLVISVNGKLSLSSNEVVAPTKSEVFRFTNCNNLKLYNFCLDVNGRNYSGVELYRCNNFLMVAPDIRNITTLNATTFTSAIRISTCFGGAVISPVLVDNLKASPENPTHQSVRAITIDGASVSAPSENVYIYNPYIRNANAAAIIGSVKNCGIYGGWIGADELDVSGVNMRNGIYCVNFTASYGMGGFVVSGTTFVHVLQPFVTRAGNFSFVNNYMYNCSMSGIDSSETVDQGIMDLGINISNNTFIIDENIPNLYSVFLRTRRKHVMVRNLNVSNNTIRTNAGYGSFLSFDEGSVEDSRFVGNEVEVNIRDVTVPNGVGIVVFRSGDNCLFKDNTFSAKNVTTDPYKGAALSIAVPTNAVAKGFQWIDNELISYSDGVVISLQGVLKNKKNRVVTSTCRVNNNSDGVVNSSLPFRSLRASKQPTSGAWSAGDIVHNDSISQYAVDDNLPFVSDHYWVCTETGDYADSNPNNWPRFYNQDGILRGVIKSPTCTTLVDGASYGRWLLLDVDRAFKMYPTNMIIDRVVYEAYRKVSDDWVFEKSFVATVDTGGNLALDNDGQYRILIYTRGKKNVPTSDTTSVIVNVSASNANMAMYTPNPLTIPTGINVREVDNKSVLIASSATSTNVNIGGGLPVGFECSFVNLGAGGLSLVAPSGETIRGATTLSNATGVLRIRKVTSTIWQSTE